MDRDERTNVFLLVSVSEVDEVLDECLLSGLKEKKKITNYTNNSQASSSHEPRAESVKS